MSCVCEGSDSKRQLGQCARDGTRDPASTLRGLGGGVPAPKSLWPVGAEEMRRFPLFRGVLLCSRPNTERPFPFAPRPLLSVFRVRLG